MRAIAFLSAALVVLGCSNGVAATPDRNRGAKPSLRLLRGFPPTIRGSHFRPGERVRMTAGTRTVRTKANRDGYFVVTIRGTDRCDTFRVLARGSAGSYAVVKALPAPACAAARSGG